MDDINIEVPPILPNIEEELKSYLICPERLPIHQYENLQELWPREINVKELLHFTTSPVSTTLKVQRNPITGEIQGIREVDLPGAGATAQNSMSFNRAPAPPSESIRGNTSYIPFCPGSFPNPLKKLPKPEEFASNELLTIPPGFSRGINFEADGITVIKDDSGNKKIANELGVVNLLELVQEEQNFLENWNNDDKKPQLSKEVTHSENVSLPEELDVLPKSEPPVLNISSVPPLTVISEWAVLLDSSKPVTDFKEKIPEMAHEFPFELDTFQKLAILQLEQHNHVFVAAHTSAGKTVVAEYAIALSQRHMTRTIYTSPIKALSNQKYRDFKRVFKDVGLITGDFQINQTASCLIMTTEILRTMLYCGSEITRDLEFVIFDEVHYINDRERGHVWEQVLILLPAHVCVVLLSATAPNTIEFADWLGRTHKRKVYVVTTNHRPVPLKHYLYTGTGGASRDNRYLLLKEYDWLKHGYNQARDSIKTDTKTTRFHKPTHLNFTPKQEKTMWIGLIDHLKRNELLPVVAFTFSRAKCDLNADSLASLDLTTQKEKVHIKYFLEKCINHLKEPDREIPQIKIMREILYRGVGVHHSGILPIIKEIVEMLFQDGLIKLLFATETFAMGVNMPARTVVFDSVTKHDGQERRHLKSAEYIQMAGRAGRRGLDKEGTVIILCKNKIPAEDELKKMMIGIPKNLESQFRITYGMVLSLLRVENITVEGMMSRSFREAGHQKKMAEVEEQLKQVEEQLEEGQELSNYLQPLINFYNNADNYLRKREQIWNDIMSSPKVTKVLVPGKILLITHQNYVNKLGLLLSVIKGIRPMYKVLILTNSQDEEYERRNDLWYKMLSLAKDLTYHISDSPNDHKVLTISMLDILEITKHSIKIDTDVIIRDWEKRQIERFANESPGPTCNQAIQELHKISMMGVKTMGKIDYLHFIHDLKINEQQYYHELNEMYKLKDNLIDYLNCTQIPNFEQQFSNVFNRKFLESKRDDLKHFLSSGSLSLYPDYRNRMDLLKELKFINSQDQVDLKGRVACEMGMHELLITELLMENILSNLQPAEVAAVLSALVFPPKRNDIPSDLNNLTPDLKKAIKKMQEIHRDIAQLERNLQINTDEFQIDLNFDLAEIVFEWASGKSFADIMLLTDIQEGIIVRGIQQLNDTICDVRNAARIIGDPILKSKMEEASAAIKRDIVFAPSLYTSEK